MDHAEGTDHEEKEGVPVRNRKQTLQSKAGESKRGEQSPSAGLGGPGKNFALYSMGSGNI